jgi:hypothetical protein
MQHLSIILDAATQHPALAAVVRDWANTGRTDITAARLGRAIRDRHLIQARAMVGSTPELFHAARRFESIVWPRWRRLADPPDSANALHRILFHARQGAEFPDSIRQYERIFRHTRPE